MHSNPHVSTSANYKLYTKTTKNRVVTRANLMNNFRSIFNQQQQQSQPQKAKSSKFFSDNAPKTTKNRVVTRANLMNNFRSIFNQQQQQSQPQKAKSSKFFSDNAPKWIDLSHMVDEQSKAIGTTFTWDPEDLITGPPNTTALKRTFGKPGEPKITLYRDHATWCPYCHKILLMLEEKQIPYNVVKINMRCYGDKPREFLAKVPNGLLPVLEVDGQIITESATIQQLLEKWYPHPALSPPAGTEESARAASLLRLERQLFGDWLQWLCNGWGNDQNRSVFMKTLDTINAELGQAEGPYFLSDFSIVDIVFAPFLERIVASIAYYKGLHVRGQGTWPNIDRWFDALETRPAYIAYKSDHYTHCHDLPPQLGGCISIPEAAAVAAALDGTDGTSWKLPLSPLSSTSLPEVYSPGDDPPKDRLQAAAKLVSNHSNVVKFALRGVGSPGPRPVSAPLSDPTAIPNSDYEKEIDAALRHVAHALLLEKHDGVGLKNSDSGDALQSSDEAAAWLSGAPVALSLGYLRDRVGVPRDLPLPAARQLRAYLNWFIDLIEEI